MPSFRERKTLPCPLGTVFDLVQDVERYPEFLPWCRAVRILSREAGGAFTAEMIVHFNGFSESYVSRVCPTPPQNGRAAIDVSLVRGPFKHLTNAWQFDAVDDLHTAVECFVDFQFSSKILDKLIGGMFEKVSRKMVDAFEARANTLYCPVS